MKDIDGIVSAIREQVSAADAARAMGIPVNRHGRCSCLWHEDNHPSMKLYSGDRGCYCFACHHGGSVIDMVQQANSFTFWQAVKWLNSAFSLGLPIGRELDENAKLAAKTRREVRERRKETARAIDRAMYDLYADAVWLLGGMENDAERYRPTDRNGEWDERFCAAMRWLPEARETVKEIAMHVIGVNEK